MYACPDARSLRQGFEISVVDEGRVTTVLRRFGCSSRDDLGIALSDIET